MALKKVVPISSLQPPGVDIEHIPLADTDFKITDTVTKFDLLELHYWSQKISIDQADDVFIWESNFPKCVIPHTYQFPELIRLCQSCYFPDQRAIINHEKKSHVYYYNRFN